MTAKAGPIPIPLRQPTPNSNRHGRPTAVVHITAGGGTSGCQKRGQGASYGGDTVAGAAADAADADEAAGAGATAAPTPVPGRAAAAGPPPVAGTAALRSTSARHFASAPVQRSERRRFKVQKAMQYRFTTWRFIVKKTGGTFNQNEVQR
eukprot:356576-Chlamydomonas_euryale.AAC.1